MARDPSAPTLVPIAVMSAVVFNPAALLPRVATWLLVSAAISALGSDAIASDPSAPALVPSALMAAVVFKPAALLPRVATCAAVSACIWAEGMAARAVEVKAPTLVPSAAISAVVVNPAALVPSAAIWSVPSAAASLFEPSRALSPAELIQPIWVDSEAMSALGQAAALAVLRFSAALPSCEIWAVVNQETRSIQL